MSVTKRFSLNVDLKTPSTFTGRSTEDGVPVSAPLKSLEDLLAWQPHDPDDKGQMFSVACVRHRPKMNGGQRSTLVCHDFKGGYVEDRFVQGVTVTSIPYQMLHWDKVDIFVYFSHHFITIPPVGWINAAHRNGVTVLGTFITEWDEGYSRCKAIFSCPEIWKIVADKLVSLARFYGFDGWLLNIENKLQLSHVPSLISFVEYLTKEMHAIDHCSKVIWYDSVTDKGDLDWQNELNEKNSCFFDICDGIFLNYTWTKDKLQSSWERADSRVADVFVGVDVFGRGCFGGGGFKTSAALKVVESCGLSEAIFAPGWIHEKLGAKDFYENDENFWQSLSPYFAERGRNMNSVNFKLPDLDPYIKACDVKLKCIPDFLGRKNNFFNLSDQDLRLSNQSNVSTDYSLDHISWKEGENQNFLLLSFTLFFPNNDDFVQISYVTQQQFNQTCKERHVDVIAYCGAFRFNNLVVPNSLINGNCSVTIRIYKDTLTLEY